MLAEGSQVREQLAPFNLSRTHGAVSRSGAAIAY